MAEADFIELLDIDLGNFDCFPSPLVDDVVVVFAARAVSFDGSDLTAEDDDVRRDDLGGEAVIASFAFSLGVGAVEVVRVFRSLDLMFSFCSFRRRDTFEVAVGPS